VKRKKYWRSLRKKSIVAFIVVCVKDGSNKRCQMEDSSSNSPSNASKSKGIFTFLFFEIGPGVDMVMFSDGPGVAEISSHSTISISRV
jgi:hypothetical protein